MKFYHLSSLSCLIITIIIMCTNFLIFHSYNLMIASKKFGIAIILIVLLTNALIFFSYTVEIPWSHAISAQITFISNQQSDG